MGVSKIQWRSKPSRASSCTGKVIYFTEATALAGAARLEAHNHRRGHLKVILDVYQCQHCTGWHLTHRRK